MKGMKHDRHRLFTESYTALWEAFSLHVKRLGYRKNTCHMLRSYALEFLHAMEEKGMLSLLQVSEQDLRAYYRYLSHRPNYRRDGGLSGHSLTHHRYTLTTFFAWLQSQGHIPHNPMSGLSLPKAGGESRQPLSSEEIGQLYSAAESYRDRAILHLFYACGLRREEAVKLDIGDILPRSHLLHVREGKGAKRRVVPLTPKVAHDLKLWLYEERERYAAGAHSERAFMLNTKGRRMLGDSYLRRLKQLCEKADLQKPVCLHVLRHSIATHLLENGMAVEYVRDFLGHKCLESTQVYAHVSQKLLNERTA